MPARSPDERDKILSKFADKLDFPPSGKATLQQAYDVFKEIEGELHTAEDDPMLYNALMVVRSSLREAMETRAKELGESDHWAKAMRGHDARLILNPLFRAQSSGQEYVAAYRAMSDEQRAALQYMEQIAGVRLPSPEAIEADLRWNQRRAGTFLRLVPDLRFGSWFGRLKAILVGTLLTVGLALSLAGKLWFPAIAFFVLLAIALVTWNRDLHSRSQRN